MSDSIPTPITEQVSWACALIEAHLASTLQAIHLYGSALDGGLKPYSDIDLLVTVSERPDEMIRQVLLVDLLSVSAPPGEDENLRALEVTLLVHNEVVPWRYPARRELQFGEWLRKDLLASIFEPGILDTDLAILLTKARQQSLAIVGPAAEELFESVPERDFLIALADTVNQWNSPVDWKGDERNIVLTLARIWYSAATGNIAPKDRAADWLLKRLPIEYQPILHEARQAHLGHREDNLAAVTDQTAEFILFAKAAIIDLLQTQTA